MTLQEFVRAIRLRWLTVALATIVATLVAMAFSLLSTPLYEASTRLFVSTTSGASTSDLYQGNRYSQERVLSYTELLMGQTIAQQVVDKLGLETNADELRERVKATAKRDTVLINVSVLDSSPVRARDIANALSDEFVRMVQELETPSPGLRPQARVVVEQRANVPINPVVPKTKRNVALAIILGATVGIALAVLRDLLDNTVKTREQLEEITGAGTVGMIPASKSFRNSPAISFDKETSPAAESFRKLRTNLQFLAVDNPPRVILITSSAPSEGKSTTAINVALALAEAGHNVVIVDGDMRRPALARYLDLVGSVGLTTVISGATDLSGALQGTKFNGLTALTAGAEAPNPSELLGSLAAKTLIDELRERFDYVILDSAPLLAVTDSAVLANDTDGVLIIGRFGKTSRDQLRHAVESLNSVGAKILGTVFTFIPTHGAASSTYSYDYYGYGSSRSRHPASDEAGSKSDDVQPRQHRAKD